MTPEQAAILRKPFEPQQIGKLPKPYKKDSPKSNCRECGGYHGQPAVHLDYVGHAATTDRLLQVDPEWSWEPMAYDMGGLPLFDGNRNLWIKLTVCGVTRIGVGDGLGLKECIGDAIRNAAMRFGVALDLWAKEDLHTAAVERGSEATSEAPADDDWQPPAEHVGSITDSAKSAAWEAWKVHSGGRDTAAMKTHYEAWCAQPFADATPDQFALYAEHLTQETKP
jgi:hypothetical protein